MDIVTILSVALGIVLIGIFVADVVSTVLVPNGGPGFLSRRLYWWVWSVWCAVSSFAGKKHRTLLSRGEALLMVLTTLTWAFLLTLGFAFVYLPFADLLTPSPVEGMSAFTASLYVSAYSATTLGVGDLYPTTATLRLLLTLEALLGFMTLTAAMSYLLSVGNAIQASSATALYISSAFSSEKSGVDRVVHRISNTSTERSQEETILWLQTVHEKLSNALRTNEQYPLIGYYHSPSNQAALPLATGSLLEYLTVLATMVPDTYGGQLKSSLLVPSSIAIAKQYAAQSAAHMNHSVSESRHDNLSDNKLFEQYYSGLHKAGVQLREESVARRDYVKQRREWAQNLEMANKRMMYPSWLAKES